MNNSTPIEGIERAILLIRGHKVMLDADLAILYGVSVGRLNEAVKRNNDRFPSDFMFQLSQVEFQNLKRQMGEPNLKSQMRYQVPTGVVGAMHPMLLQNKA